MTFSLSDDMRAIIQSAHLCFAATVSADGRPNLSPKGTIRVYDEARLFFFDIASPRTRANIVDRPWMEVVVVDQLSRRGYRFGGIAEYFEPETPEFARALSILRLDDTAAYPLRGVVILSVDETASLISPGYEFIRHESDMRTAWRKRREELEAEFDDHLGNSAST